MTGSFRIEKTRPRDIKRAAEELLRKAANSLGWDGRQPVPVEDILEKTLGLTLEYRDLNKYLGTPGVLGATWIKEKLVRIQHGLEERSFGRYCFTVGHEIGHWQIHRPLMILEREIPMLLGAIGCRREDLESTPPNIVCRDGARDQMEKEADAFAANLLMPQKLMGEAYGRVFRGGLSMPNRAMESNETRLEWINHNVAPAMISDGGFTNCSRLAMMYRISDLRLVDTSGTLPLL